VSRAGQPPLVEQKIKEKGRKRAEAAGAIEKRRTGGSSTI
jgi:hypothetical protein